MKRYFLCGLFIILLINLVSAITISGDTHSVSSSVTSLQGGNATGSIYDAVTYLTANIGGSANGSVYSGIIGFFGKFKRVPILLPTLSIISPKNKTYLENSIFLNYSISGQQAVWYSLDSKENITLQGPVIFFGNQGEHILYVYATDGKGGVISENISFSVDKNKFKIKNKKGGSLNLSVLSYEELQNLSNLMLEDLGKGKIKFNQNINITEKTTDSDEVDLDSFINISQNRIEINSTILSNFNKSATLELNNLIFANPRILRNGEICPSSICTKEDYSGGTLTFNVTGFSIYSSEETPAGTSSSSSSSEATGGAILNINIENFSVDVEDIKISLTPGSITTRKIIVTNTGNKKISLSIKEDWLKDFLIIDKNKIGLNPNESKEITFDIAVRENVLPDLYVGEIIISGSNKQKEIPVILEVESKGALFDVRVNIPEEYQKVNPGKEVLAEIELFNLGEIKRSDVEIEYIIGDNKGNKISMEKETMAVETKAGFLKRIKVPEDAKYGKYILYIKVTYNKKAASATEEFNVVRSFWGIGAPILLIILAIAIVLIVLRKRLKAVIRKSKKTLRLKKRFKKIIRRIRRFLKNRFL